MTMPPDTQQGPYGTPSNILWTNWKADCKPGLTANE
uniref:Uncharacterized protein n=1 Tax=Anguilla anguilla TaxID=7936 RepID=A0A0E9VE55_ANGAN